jgi:hypothetical protein
VTQADRILKLIRNEPKIVFAKRAKIAAGSLFRILAGAPMSRATAQKIARVSGVTIDWLLSGSDDPIIAETPAPYGAVDRAARKALAEFLEFWKTANDAKKRHLLKQMRWLREHQEQEQKKRK